MLVKTEARQAVETVMRERFPGKVEHIEMEPGSDQTGEEILVIRVFLSTDTTASDFKGRFFGLTELVRSALGDEWHGVFPIIRLVESHA
ncbi:hypothetical protein [Pararhodospirillum oryzae]|uniref:Uncharacterized protein n=1 Tax=Pararhodospirillum oryzae TaxID=478448 RepID=A0A512HBA4_9PROT|nr:hypothetical protein [Pararhodospirillum oryzae]GEO82733.1 hypothetical protein ROR02_28640 [Pararhodospirillum oryzae]